MPELPDVEWARARLRRWMRGATITAARSADRRILRPQAPAAFGRALDGRRVRDVSRRGKWLRIELDGGVLLFSHLGMTGGFARRDPAAPALAAERARFDLAPARGKPSSVRYVDARRFGRLIVAERDIPEWTDLGPDPLADGIDSRRLAQTLGRRRLPVKVALLDQSTLAGVGNILAIEALWRARIDPRSRSDALAAADVGRIGRALQAVIRHELAERERGGDDEVDERAHAFDVYGRAGEPCPRCGTVLVAIVLGGRGTTFCPGCQVRR